MGSAGIMQVEHTADCFGGAWFKSPLTDTDLCHCGETQTMSHIFKFCPLGPDKTEWRLISGTLCR